jgi:hypothetical protein
MKKIFVILFMTISGLSAQTFQLTGQVTDSKTGEPLVGANVFLKELNFGTTTNNLGAFEFKNIKADTFSLTCSYLGYESKTVQVELNTNENINIKLLPVPFLLKETVVEAARAQFRKTPIAFAQLDNRDLDKKLGSRDVVHILESTPSVYISSQGGGMGDLRLNMRGFGQTNIAVMVNGVPVNNPENGEVYWTNWAGISDVVDYMQVQRGLGANPYSVSAIGGVVNIVTYGVGAGKEFTKIRTEFGSENFRKITASFAQEIIPGKIGMTALVSKKSWDGYADRTWFDEFTYFLSLGGIFGNHSFELQLMGSPQNHGQRMTMQTIKFWKSHGQSFNTDWGYLYNRPINIRDNVFHKPSININHNWQISKSLVMSNVIYYTYGEGGGITPPWGEFRRTAEGLVDFEKEWEKNTSTILSDVDPNLFYTENALRFTVHKDYWSGIISNIRYNINSLDLSAGIDARYYAAENYRKIDNLLGGDYTLFSGNINIDPYTKISIGDITDYNADSFVRQFGGFVQAEYDIEPVTVYANFSASNTGYKRLDYFNYATNDPRRETDWKDIIGFTVKHGYNLNLDNSNSVFVNLGYFSRAPLSENVYDYSNNEYQNIKNEKILNIESGYGYQTSELILKINAYFTTWKDKAIRTDVQDAVTEKRYFYNISGANARHVGLEAESKYAVSPNLILEGMISYSVNKWTNNVNAVVAPESNPLQQKEIKSYVGDIFVGGFPMTSASLAMNYSIDLVNGSKFYFNPVYNFSGRFYAQYNPDQRNNPSDEGLNPWRIPDHFLVDVHLGYSFNLQNAVFKNLSLALHVFNILDNNNYIIDALDGIDHNSNTALVWYGRNRWWNLSVTLDF